MTQGRGIDRHQCRERLLKLDHEGFVVAKDLDHGSPASFRHRLATPRLGSAQTLDPLILLGRAREEPAACAMANEGRTPRTNH